MSAQYSWIHQMKWYSLLLVVICFSAEIVRNRHLITKYDEVLGLRQEANARVFINRMLFFEEVMFKVNVSLYLFGLYSVCFDFFYLAQVFALMLTGIHIVLIINIGSESLRMSFRIALGFLRVFTLIFLWIYLNYWSIQRTIHKMETISDTRDYSTFSYQLKYTTAFIYSFAVILSTSWLLGKFIDKP
jgi:hypothetical protein